MASTKLLAAWFVLLLLVSGLSRALVRGSQADRCRFDGAAIDRVHRVDLMVDGTARASFCSIACALAWPDLPASSYWQVRDEMSGALLDAARATFVESRVVTVPARAERIHAFASVGDAASHCEAYGGTPIGNPFARAIGAAPAR